MLARALILVNSEIDAKRTGKRGRRPSRARSALSTQGPRRRSPGCVATMIALTDGIAYNTMMKIRPLVVLDTDVLEAALRSRRGASFAILSRIGTGTFDIAISVPLVLEYEAVLTRQAGEMGRSADSVVDLIDYLCNMAKRQTIFFLWRPFLPDANDDMILELAVAAGCDAIVTHNSRDFRKSAELGMPILSPADFLRSIGANP